MALVIKLRGSLAPPPKDFFRKNKDGEKYKSVQTPWPFECNHKGQSKDPRCNDYRNNKRKQP